MSLIDCRECDSPYCDGCNIYILATALSKGKFDWMKTEKNSIDTSWIDYLYNRIAPLVGGKNDV